MFFAKYPHIFIIIIVSTLSFILVMMVIALKCPISWVAQVDEAWDGVKKSYSDFMHDRNEEENGKSEKNEREIIFKP